MSDTKKELKLEELEKAAGGARQRYFRYIVQSGDTLESVALLYVGGGPQES